MHCAICGRPLAGARIDHPFHCRIALAMRGGPEPVELRPVYSRPRISIREGSEADPLAVRRATADALAGRYASAA